MDAILHLVTGHWIGTLPEIQLAQPAGIGLLGIALGIDIADEIQSLRTIPVFDGKSDAIIFVSVGSLSLVDVPWAL